ncbi:MAG TPA: dTDP-4-dehydrorhamnose reductase [Kofleriaceae bacterium]|nr:dTDP-4-dehydrorhamnose reductase [Kofleriaceae bacterium]
MSAPRRVLVTGGGGRLARALVRGAAADGDAAFELVALDRTACDITNADSIARALDAHVAGREPPGVVINAAAFTGVDRAETERDAAFAVNATGAGTLARACAERGLRLLHVSTDHVFGGTAARPYREHDATAPRSVYGASKAAGEEAVRNAGGTVVRTSWLFGEGPEGFVPAIAARLRAGERVRVVDDQHGCPTYADDLAAALRSLVTLRELPDVLHYCGEGPTTWHGFAGAIAETLGVDPSRIDAVSTRAYGAAAPRPAYSVLDTERMRRLGIAPRPWRRGLLTTLQRR